MALVGTVSGSNGTTVSAVTGSLIVAANPGTITPVRPTDVVLYVSGAATSIGADVPSILFKGDSFISGALGTDSYLQLKPVGTLQIPTNTTASYIYTSGSTNDIYFTQFSGSYQNNVRLRWLEGALTTGLLNGGVVSTANGTTTFSVTAGAGIIVTQNAGITSDPYPTIEYVTWPAFVSSSLDYSGSAQITYVAVDLAGSLTQLNTPPTLAQYKDRIILGRVLHQTSSVTNGAVNTPAMAYAVSANALDFIRPFGPLKISGHVLAASGSTLGLTKTAGDSFAEGRNYTFDPSNPNIILAADDPALVDCKIYYQYVSGSTTIANTGTGNAGFAVIDQAQYNNNGELDAVGNSEWTNQRVYWFPRAVNRALFVYYGCEKYDTLDEALDGLLTENFVEGDNTKGSAIFVGTVSVKGNETNLSDTTTAKITQAGLFRASFGGGGGGGTTPPAGSTTQVQFNDAGAFGGSANFTFNNITNALTVTGDITGSNLRLTGDAAVFGGDLTTTATTFNLVTGSASTVNFAGTATAVNIGAQSGRTTITNDLAVGTGNIIGAPGSGGNVMTLLSSGNIVARLDVNNDAAGHRFIVQDYTGASQFFVGEDGNAELTGSFTATGSIKAFSGFSGSLTKLTDGTDYLIAGSNITLTTGSSGAVTVANTSIPTLGAVYGGGAHGAFDLDGTNTYASQFTKVGSTYTQIADVRATTFRVRSGSIAQPSQFWIYAESAFRNDGTIRNNGNSGSLGVAGATVAAAGTLQCQGQGGVAGRTTTANGFVNSVLQVIGGGGGTGGAGGASTGGASTATPPGATSQAVGTSFFRTTHRRLDVITVGTVTAGIGGGSGGATLNSGTATSGASGGGGSAIRINARSFQNDGTITCNGGAGGNATTTGDAVAGGGGGGGGGFIGIMCDTLVSLGTVTCTGGLGGLGSGGGTAGGMGLSGSISVMTPTGTTNL